MAEDEKPGVIKQDFGTGDKSKEYDPNNPDQNPRQGLPSSVRLEEDATPVPLTDLPDPKDSAGPWIHYIGVATLRIMDEDAWHNAGVDSKSYHQWNFANKKCIPRSHFTDPELTYLLRVDGRFELTDSLPK